MVYASLAWSVGTFPRNPVARSSRIQMFWAQVWPFWTASQSWPTQVWHLPSCVWLHTYHCCFRVHDLGPYWCSPRSKMNTNHSFWTDLKMCFCSFLLYHLLYQCYSSSRFLYPAKTKHYTCKKKVFLIAICFEPLCTPLFISFLLRVVMGGMGPEKKREYL